MAKRFTIKVYNNTGVTFQGVLSQVSNYGFNEVINAGLGQLNIDLPTKFNDDLPCSVTHSNKVEIWVQDKDTIGTSGLCIYSGYVFEITREITDEGEKVTLGVLGYGTTLAQTPDMSSTTNPQVIRNGFTITNAFKDIIDKYITTSGLSIVNYSATSVETSASLVSYTSNNKTSLDSLERIKLMAGSTWFWKVDASNVFWAKQFSATPVHTLTMGREIGPIRVVENSADIVNYFILWNGLQKTDTNFINNAYTNTASVTAYGKRFAQQTDGRLKDPTYHAQLGTAFINVNKDLNRIVEFDVWDNNYNPDGYDIESIHVGDTVRVLNNKQTALYNGNLIIYSIVYSPDKIHVKVADSKTITSRKLNDLRKQLDQTTYDDGVNLLTVVSV